MKKLGFYTESLMLKRVDELIGKMEDRKFRFEMEKEFAGSRKRKTHRNMDYEIICSILARENNGNLISRTTVWRLIRLKEKNPEIYRKVLENSISVRFGYELVFPGKNKKPENTENIGEPDIKKMKSDLTYFLNGIRIYREKFSCVPSDSDFEELDTLLFELRKELNRTRLFYDSI